MTCTPNNKNNSWPGCFENVPAKMCSHLLMSEKVKAKRQVFLCVTKPENYTNEEKGREKNDRARRERRGEEKTKTLWLHN